VRNAERLVTMDERRSILEDAGLFAADGVIQQVGPTRSLPCEADEIIDARGMVVLPGLVNTHHHLFQGLTRCLPVAQNHDLYKWLLALYPVWAKVTREACAASARLVLAELVLSGCTTVFDHHYLFPRGMSVDPIVEAARELGVRLMIGRGGQTMTGGVAPAELCESEVAILADCERLLGTYHDPRGRSMCRVVIAPQQLLRIEPRFAARLARFAREHSLRLHTHLAETAYEVELCLQLHGCRPLEYAERSEWIGPDVWYAHGVHMEAHEIARLARAGTGVAHCPSSNMRLGSGIAPVRQMCAAGVPVGLAVDGSASNDSSNMLLEARLALLLQRVQGGAGAMKAEDTLAIATRGGARLLGREELGSLSPGQAADFIGVDTRRREFAGAQSDPVAALVFCVVPTVDLSVINGRVRVRDGELLGFDWATAVREHNRQAGELLRRDEYAV
jgi:cytosine/adenosine deaminase-related metal-dependent hydrolase